MRPTRATRIALIVAAIATLSSCGGKKKQTTPTVGDSQGPHPEEGVLEMQKDVPDGLTMRLSDSKDSPYQPVERRPVKAEKLSQADADALLARLPALKGEAEDKKDFALRERSLPPPRTGETVKQPFPPPDSQAPPAGAVQAGGELTVLRFAPEGEVPLAPHLSITFSQPMIAISAHADTVAGGVPVKLSPEPKGRWRWVGTRTLLFDPEPRFPQATEYRVEIPAGTKSATGGALAKAVTFTFTTPAPRVTNSWPGEGPQERDVPMFVAFDQAVDAAAVLATISVEAKGQRYPVRALTAEEIAANATITNLIDAAEKNEQSGRYVTFRARELLPVDSRIEVDIGPGTPSEEGPRVTQSVQSFSFRTYGPLEVEEARCSWGSNCPPMTPWYVRFSNPIDAEKFDADAITIEPELPGKRIDVNGRFLNIRGRSKGRTTYTVTLPATLTDEFGQTLGEPEELSFRVGNAEPNFWGPGGLVVLDPAAKKHSLDVFSTNYDKLKVRVYAVTPRDWDAFAQYMHDPYDKSRQLRTPPGKRVVDQVVAVKSARDELVETAIDVGPALVDGLGHAIVVVEPTPWPHRWNPPVVHAWVQSTRIGLDAFVDDSELLAWTTRLADGTPLSDIELEIVPFGTKARTGEKGLARMPLGDTQAKGRHLLVARSGKDVAFLPESTYWWSDHGGWSKRDQGESLRWYVFDDRQMYRPGEEVHLKGWIRRVDNGEGGDLMALGGAASQLSYKVFGPRGNEIVKGTTQVNAIGGFDTKFKLPTTPNLGWARVELEASGAGTAGNRRYNHGFQIQEFRRPEFAVEVNASQGPHVVGGSADITVEASYYAGGGLPNAEVSWNVTAAPGTFRPPNRDDFTFGVWVPWWGWGRFGAPGHGNHHSSFNHQAKTDALGKHTLRVDFVSVKPPQPMNVTANASVMDVNRQAWGASASLLVHPSDLYVGLKSGTYFVERGEPIEIDAIVVDHDGKAVPGQAVRVRAVRLEWAYERGEYVTKELDEQTCAHDSGEEPKQCSFATKEGGRYRITARVVDERGRPNETEITVWVSGGEQPAAREVEQEEVTLIPDRKQYKPGDQAKILVQSPFYPAEGVLSIRRSGIVSAERFSLGGPTTTLTIPIEEGYTPNVHVQVDLVGANARLDDRGKPVAALPKRPAYAVGSLNLSVPPEQRTLAVSATPRERKLAPGGKTKIDITVRDAAGKPVADAEVALVVVDESVLALSNYQLADPIATFYSQRPPGARDHHLRAHVKLARPEADVFDMGNMAPTDDRMMEQRPMELEESAGAPPPPAPGALGGLSTRTAALARKGGGGKAPPPPITVRTNFDALAVFAPEVRTDAGGRAVVDVTVPDNLTRYRVMAVAVAGAKQFGKGESSITARMPLMVRPSAPRFLNFGDTFELPVVLQNQTDAPMDVRVAVRTLNAAITEGTGRRVRVPENDRVEIRFPAAAELPGTARFQVAAAADQWSDASEFALPVWTPATTEAFADYGEIDAGAVRRPVALPGAVFESFGGLEVTTSSTQLQELTDAFLYLVSYPFECSEQLASRVLAVAALRDVLTAFQAEGLPPPDEIAAAVERDIKKLAGMQNGDGGFGFWRRGTDSWPYLSIHVANALARAKAKGFTVPGDMLDLSLGYLRRIEGHIPGWYPAEVRRTLVAYALYTRRVIGDDPGKLAEEARALIDRAGLETLSLEAVGWSLGVLTGDRASKNHIARIHRHLQNRATETAATANFTTSYADGAYLILHSSRRADGIILESLIADQPASDLIPKLVRGLLAHRTRGRWGNTQENAFVLLALDRYFQVYEKVTPNFVARVWLDDRFAGEHRFKGRTTERQHIDIPMSYVAAGTGKHDLILQKDGKGRMYYRVGMTYAPESLRLEPADHGFAIERRYEAVDKPSDVERLKDGTWKVKAGARVRVRVTMVAENRRYHVALVDPLPAGLEAMNPALAVTGEVPRDPSEQARGPYWWWMRTWYEHQNMRDERIEAFTSLLWAGVHEYSYVARATTPGRFVVPPAKAEEMYFPETFGRSASDVVVVE